MRNLRTSIFMPPQLQRVGRLTSWADVGRMPALRYWLSWPPAERVAAVEHLRRQIDGSATTLPGGEPQRPEDCNGAETAPAGEAHGLNPLTSRPPGCPADIERLLERSITWATRVTL